MLDGHRTDEDIGFELSLRPRGFDEYVGQEQVKENLKVAIAAARARGDVLDHILFHGPPGLGKTSLAYIIAREMGVNIKATSGPIIERAGDLAALLTNLDEGDVLFIDEIHRLNHVVEEVLYPAMEDYQIDIMVGQGPAAQVDQVAAQTIHPDRRDHPLGLADFAAARSLRPEFSLGFLRSGVVGAHSQTLGGDPRRRGRRGRHRRDRGALARHAAHRQPAAAPGARLRPGERQRHDHQAR